MKTRLIGTPLFINRIRGVNIFSILSHLTGMYRIVQFPATATLLITGFLVFIAEHLFTKRQSKGKNIINLCP